MRISQREKRSKECVDKILKELIKTLKELRWVDDISYLKHMEEYAAENADDTEGYELDQVFDYFRDNSEAFEHTVFCLDRPIAIDIYDNHVCLTVSETFKDIMQFDFKHEFEVTREFFFPWSIRSKIVREANKLLKTTKSEELEGEHVTSLEEVLAAVQVANEISEEEPEDSEEEKET